MKKKKQCLTANMNKEAPPIGLLDDVDRACNLILECLDVNNISKSAGISAMATVMVSILVNCESSGHFYAVIKMMEDGFKEARVKNDK